jgi:hypothetical protein
MLKRSSLLASVILTLSLHSGAFAAGGPNDLEALQKLTPPVSVKGGQITGAGDDRKAEVVIKNEGEKALRGVLVEMLLLRADGTVSSSVPHTQGGFYSGSGGGSSTLGRGASFPLKIGSMFIKPDMVAVDGLVREITFEDKSTWPALPATPPQKINGEPVAAKMIGVLGSGDKAQPVVACFNYGTQSVQAVFYEIDYLDAAGKRLTSTNFGHTGSRPIMEVGAGIVFTGGGAPPAGTTSVRVRIGSVKFSDKSEWKAAGRPAR